METDKQRNSLAEVGNLGKYDTRRTRLSRMLVELADLELENTAWDIRHWGNWFLAELGTLGQSESRRRRRNIRLCYR